MTVYNAIAWMTSPSRNMNLNPLFVRLLLLGLVVWLAAAAAVSAQPLLLTGATVHSVTGAPLSPGQVLIKNGRIAAVGVHLSAPAATVVDLSGQHLYPGLIALNTVLGLTEISAVRATEDTTEVGDYTPEVQSWIAVNPDSELIPVARANGIAYFEPAPHGGIVAGQSALLATDGWGVEQMAVRKPVALHLYWPAMDLEVRDRPPSGTKVKNLEQQARERYAKLRDLVAFFDDARAYAQAKAAAAKGQASAPAVIPAWESMLPYVEGRLPVVVHADTVRQLRAVLAWASTNQFQIILAGGREATRVADLLAAAKIPVIYPHTFTQPFRDIDPYDAPFATPETLRRAGIKVVFSLGSDSFNAPLIKNLPYAAAQAVAFGLPRDEALKALTLYPAQIAGVADRLGSIEPGKEASLFAADGDILDIRSQVTRMWIAGAEVSLENRHTRLYRKYQARPRPVLR